MHFSTPHKGFTSRDSEGGWGHTFGKLQATWGPFCLAGPSGVCKVSGLVRCAREQQEKGCSLREAGQELRKVP